MNEIWKDVIGFEGMYQVSNLGNVKSLDRFVYSGRNKTRIQHGKPKKPTINQDGYSYVLLYKNNKIKQSLNHRLAAIAFIPNPENKETVNHIDGDKNNNNISNLEWCTMSENVKHAWRTGLSKPKFGNKANNRKLTEKQVSEIKLLLGTITHKEIAIIYNVSRSAISMIACNKNWT